MTLKPSDKKIIETAFEMGSGYVLDFSDKKMVDFFEGEFEISIYDKKYDFDYPSKSKANRLRGILQFVDEPTAGKIVLGLIDCKESIERDFSESEIRLIAKARQIGDGLIISTGNNPKKTSTVPEKAKTDRSIYKNLNHEEADNVLAPESRSSEPRVSMSHS